MLNDFYIHLTKDEQKNFINNNLHFASTAAIINELEFRQLTQEERIGIIRHILLFEVLSEEELSLIKSLIL